MNRQKLDKRTNVQCVYGRPEKNALNKNNRRTDISNVKSAKI